MAGILAGSGQLENRAVTSEIESAYLEHNTYLLKAAHAWINWHDCNRVETAQFCVTDMWIRAVRFWDDCRHDYKLSRVAWLRTILRNTVLDYQRREMAGTRRVDLVPLSQFDEFHLSDRQHSSAYFELRHSSSYLELRLDLSSAIDRLSPSLRIAAVSLLQGSADSSSIGRVRCHRARIALRQLLRSSSKPHKIHVIN